MKAQITCAAAAIALNIAMLAAYDFFITRPARTIGVVDTLAVFRFEEERLSKQMARELSPQQRDRVAEQAKTFAAAFPTALEQIAAECRCVVVERTALIGTPPHLVDLTPELKRRMGQQ